MFFSVTPVIPSRQHIQNGLPLGPQPSIQPRHEEYPIEEIHSARPAEPFLASPVNRRKTRPRDQVPRCASIPVATVPVRSVHVADKTLLFIRRAHCEK